MNLATGQVVGLGEQGLSNFESAVAKTSNQRQIINSLKVESAGGVSQFYGGALMPRLASAQATGANTNTVFELFSPEAYSSLLGQARLNTIYSMVDVPTSVLDAQTGLELMYVHTKNSTSNGSQWANYDIKSNGIKLKFTANYGMGAVTASVGADRADISSRYLHVDGDGYNASIGVAHLIPAVEGLSARAKASYYTISNSSSRTTMAGVASASGIDSNSWTTGLGLGFSRSVGSFRLGANVDAFYYHAKVDGFTENNPTYKLDALNVNSQSQSGFGWTAGVNIETTIKDQFDIGLGLGVIQFANSSSDVTASVVSETTSFTVSNPGFGDTLYTADLSARYRVNGNWAVKFDAQFIGDSASHGNSRFILGVNYNF